MPLASQLIPINNKKRHQNQKLTSQFMSNNMTLNIIIYFVFTNKISENIDYHDKGYGLFV